MAEVWIQSLVRELKSHKLSSMAKNKNRRFFKSRILQTLDLGHIGLGQSFVFLKKKKRFFCCGPFQNSLLNLIQYCFCLTFLFSCIWDPSSLTRYWTRIPCNGGWSLNHQTTREVLRVFSEASEPVRSESWWKNRREGWRRRVCPKTDY